MGMLQFRRSSADNHFFLTAHNAAVNIFLCTDEWAFLQDRFLEAESLGKVHIYSLGSIKSSIKD